jgi:hypothetical protein
LSFMAAFVPSCSGLWSYSNIQFRYRVYFKGTEKTID